MKKTHIECKNFLPIDVFKGICKLDKKSILADDEACEEFSQLAKCAYCTHFTASEKGTGRCKDLHDAYPDMPAKTCKDFSWKNQLN